MLLLLLLELDEDPAALLLAFISSGSSSSCRTDAIDPDDDVLLPAAVEAAVGRLRRGWRRDSDEPVEDDGQSFIYGYLLKTFLRI